MFLNEFDLFSIQIFLNKRKIQIFIEDCIQNQLKYRTTATIFEMFRIEAVIRKR